jgi:hypothetical protein
MTKVSRRFEYTALTTLHPDPNDYNYFGGSSLQSIGRPYEKVRA